MKSDILIQRNGNFQLAKINPNSSLRSQLDHTLRSQFKVACPEQGCFRTFLVTIGIARRNFGSVLVFSSTNITMEIVGQSAYCIE